MRGWQVWGVGGGCSQHTEFAKLSSDQSGEETGHFLECFSFRLVLSEMELQDLKKTGNREEKMYAWRDWGG